MVCKNDIYISKNHKNYIDMCRESLLLSNALTLILAMPFVTYSIPTNLCECTTAGDDEHCVEDIKCNEYRVNYPYPNVSWAVVCAEADLCFAFCTVAYCESRREYGGYCEPLGPTILRYKIKRKYGGILEGEVKSPALNPDVVWVFQYGAGGTSGRNPRESPAFEITLLLILQLMNSF